MSMPRQHGGFALAQSRISDERRPVIPTEVQTIVCKKFLTCGAALHDLFVFANLK